MERIPVTIITGFLGSGKTTFINNLIKKYKDKKFAIIENEIGEIGIDGGLIVGVENNIFELSNGCICCSINNDFHKTINQLLESSNKFNHLLIETTGIADPDPIIQAFISSPKIQSHFILDSVIGVADAVNLEDMIDEQPEVRKQIALSDIILLKQNRCCSKKYIGELLRLLKTINPTAKLFPVTFSDISSIDILETFSYSVKAVEKTTLSFQNLQLIRPENESQSHNHQIKTEGLIIPGAFEYGKFMMWMQMYLFFNKNKILRVKGIVSFLDEDERHIFHAVRSDFMVEKGNPWNDETRFSKLIFIGKHIDRDEIEDALYEQMQISESLEEE
ncbi:MAG: GTP-binding protein [Chloroflexia bacterium]|nr:GTP-binding protein [Chloroflexia bacterium]